MKRGKYEAAPSPKRKMLILVISLVLLVAVSAGATLAYFHLASGPVINTFQAGTVGAEVHETLNGNTEEAITVTNTGDSPVYVRVRLISYYELNDGTVDGAKASPAVSFTLGENWKSIGSYYYYTKPLGTGATTSDLLGSNVTMASGQVIEVLADTVQATPDQAVAEVWGVKTSSCIAQ